MFDLNFRHIMIALFGLTLLCMIGLGISIIIYSIQVKKPKTNTQKHQTAFATCNHILLGTFAISMILISILAISYIIAVRHGLYTTNLTLNQLYNGIEHTPIEDELPKDISGSIIIVYKFGCTDCEAIYENLSKYVADKPDIYWVSSRSEQGKNLLATYPIESVPTAIYIHVNSDDNDYTKKSLHHVDANDETHFDSTGLDRLLYLQEQNR